MLLVFSIMITPIKPHPGKLIYFPSSAPHRFANRTSHFFLWLIYIHVDERTILCSDTLFSLGLPIQELISDCFASPWWKELPLFKLESYGEHPQRGWACELPSRRTYKISREDQVREKIIAILYIRAEQKNHTSSLQNARIHIPRQGPVYLQAAPHRQWERFPRRCHLKVSIYTDIFFDPFFLFLFERSIY